MAFIVSCGICTVVKTFHLADQKINEPEIYVVPGPIR